MDDLIRFGVEVRHIPLMKALQHSPKCVNTEDWILAREELKFSRLFDRYLELRKLNPRPFNNELPLNIATLNSSFWDNMLSQCQQQRQNIIFKETQRKKLMVKLSQKILSSTSKGGRGSLALMNNNSFEVPPPIIVIPEIPNEILAPINNWSGSEQIFLMNLITKGIVKIVDSNPSGVSSATLLINSIFHRGRAARTTDQVEKLIRYQFTTPTDSASNLSLNEFGSSLLGGGGGGSKPLGMENSTTTTTTTTTTLTLNKFALTSMDSKIRNSAVRRKYDRSALMKSSSTKLIAPSKIFNPSKKLNMAPHPSHDAAARKANQNIAKLFTPHELAMRRIQKSRLGIPDTPVGAGPANANPYGNIPTLNNNSGSFNSINHNVTSSATTSGISSSSSSSVNPSYYPSLLSSNHPNPSIQQQNIQQQLQRVQQLQASQMSKQLPPQQQQQQQKQIQQQILLQQQHLQQAQNARMNQNNAAKKE